MTIVFARGTTEQGNVGTLSGPPWFDAMGKMVGAQNLAVQGVDYPAKCVSFPPIPDHISKETGDAVLVWVRT